MNQNKVAFDGKAFSDCRLSPTEQKSPQDSSGITSQIEDRSSGSNDNTYEEVQAFNDAAVCEIEDQDQTKELILSQQTSLQEDTTLRANLGHKNFA